VCRIQRLVFAAIVTLLFCESFRGTEKEPSTNYYDLELDTLTSTADSENNLIMTAVTSEYLALLSNLMHNLKHVGGFDNFVIVALDEKTFLWGRGRGLKIVFNPLTGRADAQLQDVVYGTEVYKAATKLKSKSVLRYLKLGYNVIFTDPDVIWFKNPITAIKPHWFDGIAIQSDSRYQFSAQMSLNSGLYAVKSSAVSIQAFSDIVESANAGNKSEQPYFARILCARKLSTKNACIYTKDHLGSIRVTILPLDSFPNGGYYVVNKSTIFDLGFNTFEVISGQPLNAIHNNWIKGIDNKIKRQKQHSLWWNSSQIEP